MEKKLSVYQIKVLLLQNRGSANWPVGQTQLCIFLYGLQAKSGGYIFKWWDQNQKNNNILCHMKNYMKFRNSRVQK